jgi:hypothetical protein
MERKVKTLRYTINERHGEIEIFDWLKQHRGMSIDTGSLKLPKEVYYLRF